MKKEFIPYKQALELKELGFNEGCFGYYVLTETRDYKNGLEIRNEIELNTLNGYRVNDDESQTTAPLYQQAFDWFRKQVFNQIVINDKGDYVQGMLSLLPLVYRTSYEIQVIEASKYHTLVKFSGVQIPLHDIAYKFYGNAVPTYEEAQLQCLIKLIEIVKGKEVAICCHTNS